MNVERVNGRQERFRMQQERLDRINDKLRAHGYRVVHFWSTSTGARSLRPYALIGPAEKVIGRFEFSESAEKKAERLVSKGGEIGS